MAGLPERRSREIRSARISRRPPSFAVTLVALGIVFALSWVFFLRSGPAAPTPTVEGARGTYTWRQTASDTGEDGVFSAVAGGNAGGSAESGIPIRGAGPRAAAYDATTRTATLRESRGAAVTEVRTVGAWPPVWRVATRSPLDYQGLSAIVRSAVEDGDDAVGIKPLKDGERTVWRAAIRLDGRPVDLVVDQLTGLVTWYSDGRSTFTATVDWASPPPADETYSVQAPAGTEVKTTTDDDYRYASSPAQAGRAAGYAPLASDLAPEGYALKAIATFETGDRPADWIQADRASGAVGDRALPGAAEPVIAQLYARGLSWFTVEQIGPVHGHPGREPAERTARRNPRQALLRGGDAAVRGVQGCDGRHVVRSLGAVAARRRQAPSGVRHRRPHPPGAHRVRRGAQTRPGGEVTRASVSPAGPR